ncbi:MmcQ/YjbR family DNA-binding protein [Paenibacillus flagellatus]|uniref:Phosphoribosylglycinamide formyltransferase n=1 Tax=Paenibacillus flagellatus TaxID=2211139 RepID=A0A2V5K8B0_9BACL|nr:MmcQ/YjbR family DNA-binding protein [Paenibacillus flagellatus]PYI55745.1 phosphoribosylglycinamide formyltransferase [Paenibacillus flagellatus]
MSNDSQLKSERGIDVLKRTRRICMPLPEVAENVDGFGHVVFQVGGKTFVRLGEHNGHVGLSFKSDLETQHLLIQQGGYYRTPYVGQHGWVSAEMPPDWDALADLLKEAYLRTAPKKLVKRLLESGRENG